MKMFTCMMREDRTLYLSSAEIATADAIGGMPIKSAAQVGIVAAELGMQYMAEERTFALFLDSKKYLIGCFEVSHGTQDQTFGGPKEIFRAALIAGASSLVLVHNHPSGDPSPSESDIAMTKNVVKAGALLGVPVADHVIVGKAGLSMRENEPAIFEREEVKA